MDMHKCCHLYIGKEHPGETLVVRTVIEANHTLPSLCVWKMFQHPRIGH